MQKCKNCKKEFSYRQIFKSFWKGYKPFQCSHCQTKYVHSFKNRWIVGFIIFIGTILASTLSFSSNAELAVKLTVNGVTLAFFIFLISSLSLYIFSFEEEEKTNYT